eukprot:scaffold6279_cov228-Isochrysis_galbana.AAC.3
MGGSQCECHSAGRRAASSSNSPPQTPCHTRTPTTACVISPHSPFSTPLCQARRTRSHAGWPASKAKLWVTIACA